MNCLIWTRKYKAVYENFLKSCQLDLEPEVSGFLKILSFSATVIFHDAAYQFIRIFYHSRQGSTNRSMRRPLAFSPSNPYRAIILRNPDSRFKPLNLSMTITQLLVPIVDLIVVIPSIINIFQAIRELTTGDRKFQSIQFLVPAYFMSILGTLESQVQGYSPFQNGNKI